MICPNCHVSHLLTHPEKHFADRKWLKCNLCGYSQPEGGFPKPMNDKEMEKSVEEFIDKNQELFDKLED